MTTRRHFFSLSAFAAAGLTLGPDALPQTANSITAEDVKKLQPPKRPVLITRVTGDTTIQEAWQMLASGSDTLDAIHHVCLGRENDPNDHSVGLGGLPNEEGVVELDACCMHGPSRTAGSVGGVRNIKNVCLVSRRVIQHTGHVMLVGDGAERFAVDMGFPRENLLTDDARKIWLLWKESQNGWWGPGLASPEGKNPYARNSEKKASLDRPGTVPPPSHAGVDEYDPCPHATTHADGCRLWHFSPEPSLCGGTDSLDFDRHNPRLRSKFQRRNVRGNDDFRADWVIPRSLAQDVIPTRM